MSLVELLHRLLLQPKMISGWTDLQYNQHSSIYYTHKPALILSGNCLDITIIPVKDQGLIQE